MITPSARVKIKNRLNIQPLKVYFQKGLSMLKILGASSKDIRINKIDIIAIAKKGFP